jgi:NTP pyrophosphatase (non-canonical NTP hydrolase)
MLTTVDERGGFGVLWGPGEIDNIISRDKVGKLLHFKGITGHEDTLEERCFISEVKEIIEKIKNFRDERDWMQFHDPKNMSISITIEAAELLEHFQWKTKEEVIKYVEENKEEIQDEIADIALYLFELADNLEIDLLNAMEKKLEKNKNKYPVEKAKGKHTKYNKL